MDGSSSPSAPGAILASIAATASVNGGGLLLPSSVGAAHHPYLASNFSSALGGLSTQTRGLTGNGVAHRFEQQSWTLEEQFKQVSATLSLIFTYIYRQCCSCKPLEHLFLLILIK